MIHYHGTPITPTALLREQLAGRHFCVPFPAPYQARLCHDIGQSVMLDNGAFSTWKRGHKADWPAFYAWAEEWLAFPTTWAVVPDVIDAGPDAQDALLAQWPFGSKGSPVWHMDEPIDRLVRLLDAWPRVCIGSTNQFDPPYRRRGAVGWTLRGAQSRSGIGSSRGFTCSGGLQCSGKEWPFGSVDSTDIARNHNRAARRAGEMAAEWARAPSERPGLMAARWDAMQCPGVWAGHVEQFDLLEVR